MHNDIVNNIKKYNKVYIMPHIHIDLDALGASLGIYKLIESFGLEPCIIIDETKYELGVKRALETIKNSNINIKKLFSSNISSEDLIVVVDCNKKNMVQNKEIFSLCNNVLIIDHHIENKDTINTVYKYIDVDCSSACEIITDLLVENNVVVNKTVADIMLAGITIDTNNFTIKTKPSTHEAAFKLGEMGADSKNVLYLLKEDIKEFIDMQKVIFDTEIINNIYAVCVGDKSTIYKKEQLSKIADNMLTFDKIEASFCICKINTNIIGISARSLGNIDIEDIMSRLNGGGNKYEAACMMYNVSIETAKEKLINILMEGK